jgi:hypothetical protein
MGIAPLIPLWFEGDEVQVVFEPVIVRVRWPKEDEPTGGFVGIEHFYVTDENGAPVTDESLALLTALGSGTAFASKEPEPSPAAWGLEIAYVTDENGDYVTDESLNRLTVRVV